MTVVAPRLTIRVARPFTEPIVLGQQVTFRTSNGWRFAGTVVAITVPGGGVPAGCATDVTLEATG